MRRPFLFVAVLIASTLPSFAQQAPTETLDENGNVSYNGSNPFPPFVEIGPHAVDPISGIATLEYQSVGVPNFSVRPGDLLITEPGGNSDLLRFENNQPNVTDLFVFSLNDDGVDSLADTASSFPLPNGYQSIFLQVQETGTEAGPNGVLYTPASQFDPGWDGNGVIGTYNFISDPASVPEASTWFICALTVAALLFQIRRKNNPAAAM